MVFIHDEPQTEEQLLEEVAGRANGEKYTWSDTDRTEMLEKAKGIVDTVRRFDAEHPPIPR